MHEVHGYVQSKATFVFFDCACKTISIFVLAHELATPIISLRSQKIFPDFTYNRIKVTEMWGI